MEREQPLRSRVQNGKLIISVGLDTLYELVTDCEEDIDKLAQEMADSPIYIERLLEALAEDIFHDRYLEEVLT